MATYIAKQVVGKKLESVKGALSDRDDRDDRFAEAEEAPMTIAEINEERREAERRRREKFSRVQEDREKLRQDIRDKYGLKKKEDDMTLSPGLMSEGRHGSICSRASFSIGDGRPSHGSPLSRGVGELTTKVSQMPGKVLSSVSGGSQDKCNVQ